MRNTDRGRDKMRIVMWRALWFAVGVWACGGCLDSDDDDSTPVRPDARVVDALDAASVADAATTPDAAPPDAAAPAIVVAPTSGLVTTEAGDQAVFEIVLTTMPTGAVGISITSLDPSEVTVDPGALVFSIDDWDVPIPITVTGVADGIADGDQSVTVEVRPASSSDPDYGGRDPDDVSVTNIDID